MALFALFFRLATRATAVCQNAVGADGDLGLSALEDLREQLREHVQDAIAAKVDPLPPRVCARSMAES